MKHAIERIAGSPYGASLFHMLLATAGLAGAGLLKIGSPE